MSDPIRTALLRVFDLSADRPDIRAVVTAALADAYDDNWQPRAALAATEALEPLDGFAGHDGSDTPVDGFGTVPGAATEAPAGLDVERTVLASLFDEIEALCDANGQSAIRLDDLREVFVARVGGRLAARDALAEDEQAAFEALTFRAAPTEDPYREARLNGLPTTSEMKGWDPE